jgi:hypothetical protein
LRLGGVTGMPASIDCHIFFLKSISVTLLEMGGWMFELGCCQISYRTSEMGFRRIFHRYVSVPLRRMEQLQTG